jgi:threonine synthase
MPERIPALDKQEINDMSEMAYHEIAFVVARKFLNGEIEDEALRSIVEDAYNFDIPLEKVYNRNFILRLDQGPTASFKDFAARMMGRLMQHYLKKQNRSMRILTATSGDTGSAIANAFYDLDNIEVVILFPEKEVTDRQRKQMTTLGKNIHVLSLDGKFDDCQALVKQAFADPELEHLGLSSANSINIGRLLPQSMYYFYAYSRLGDIGKDEAVFSVPSGNFGDLMGGIIAREMGLPVKKFIISTNENDEVPAYLHSGVYKTIVPSLNCISSAMNVGHPSNMARIIALYNGVMDEKGQIVKDPDFDRMQKDFWGISASDELTRRTIKKVYETYNVLLEPHGAVGWYGLESFLNKFPEYNRPDQLTITLETAHPAKFPQQIREVLHFDPSLPASLKGLDQKSEMVADIDSGYETFKHFLLTKFKS